MSEWKRIDSLAKVSRGASPRPIGDPQYFGGDVGWVRISDVTRSSRFLRQTEQYVSKLGESLSVRVNPGDLVMSICGTLGRPIIIDMPACIHDGFVQFTNLREADTTFLYYSLQHSEPAFYGMGQPGTQTNLNTGLVGRHKIFAPRIEQQRRIAEILTTVDEAMEQTEALVGKLEQMKAGLMHDLFTRGVTPDGHLRPTRQEAPHLYHETPLGWLPKEWRVVSLVQAVSQKQNAIVDGPFGSNLKTIHYRTSGVPVIQSGYVTSGVFQADEYHYVTEAHFQTQIRSKVDAGDIVMAKIGAQAGMCAVLPEAHPVSILAGNSLKISTDETVLRRELLVAYLQRLYAITGMSGVRTETAQPAISLGRLKKILIPLSSSVEQELAAKVIAGMTDQLVTQSSHLAKLRQQKQGLMQDLLTGRVRVE